MSFGIKVRSNEQIAMIQEESLIPAGEYPFRVINAHQEISKNQNSMIKLILEIDTPKGTRKLFDFLIDSDLMAYKVKHFCEMIGHNDSVLFPQNCMNKSGIAKIIIQKDKNNQYPPRNTITDYVHQELQGMIASPSSDFNDDIPF